MRSELDWGLTALVGPRFGFGSVWLVFEPRRGQGAACTSGLLDVACLTSRVHMPLPFLPPFLPLPLLSRPWYIRAVAASEPLESKAGASGADLSRDSCGDERDRDIDGDRSKGGIAPKVSAGIAPKGDRCCNCRWGSLQRGIAPKVTLLQLLLLLLMRL